jgi:hypothetical protein
MNVDPLDTAANTRWRWFARVAAVFAAVLAATALVMSGRYLAATWRDRPTMWMAVGATLAAMPFMLGFASLMGWLAWRLAFRWNAATARAAAATVVVVGLLWLTVWAAASAERWLGLRSTDTTVFDVPCLAALIVGAVAYRRVAPVMIRRAGLIEQPDVYGQPPGHAQRARAFCFVLGWMVWLTASEAARRTHPGLSQAGPDVWEAVTVLGPIALGWGTYRLVLWTQTPRTRPAVPAGGFQVLTVANPDAVVGRDPI